MSTEIKYYTCAVHTEAGEDKSSSNDDKRLKHVGVHQSSQATWSDIHINVSWLFITPRRDYMIIVEAVAVEGPAAYIFAIMSCHHGAKLYKCMMIFGRIMCKKLLHYI